MPPNVRQKGATPLKSAAEPHHLAWIVATINVATEKPASPSADGAAIGWRVTRVAQPFVEASAPESGAILACIVLIEHSPPSRSPCRRCFLPGDAETPLRRAKDSEAAAAARLALEPARVGRGD